MSLKKKKKTKVALESKIATLDRQSSFKSELDKLKAERAKKQKLENLTLEQFPGSPKAAVTGSPKAAVAGRDTCTPTHTCKSEIIRIILPNSDGPEHQTNVCSC